MLDPTMASPGPDDGYITDLIADAQADLDSEIGYSFQQDGTIALPAVRYYDGGGRDALWIDDLLSLASPGGVIETNVVSYLSGSTWVSQIASTQDITSDIVLRPNNFASLGQPANKMVRTSRSAFGEGIQNYKVSGVFGQPILPAQTYPGVPNDVSRACKRLAVHYFKMRDTNYADMLQESGNVRERYTKDWPADVKRIVAKYAHVRFLTR